MPGAGAGSGATTRRGLPESVALFKTVVFEVRRPGRRGEPVAEGAGPVGLWRGGGARPLALAAPLPPGAGSPAGAKAQAGAAATRSTRRR